MTITGTTFGPKRLLPALVVALCGVALPASVATATVGTDVVPPDLTAATLSVSRAEPGDTLEFHWEGTDDLSGITYVDFRVWWPDRTVTTLSASYDNGPTAGDLSFTVPNNMHSGLAQIQGVRVGDAQCNGWAYYLGQTPTPDTPTHGIAYRNNCGSQDWQSVPQLFNQADLVFGVGMDRPSLSSPPKPSLPQVQVEGQQLLIAWDELQPTGDLTTTFEDWYYWGTLDGSVVDATEYVSPASFPRPAIAIDNLTGKHEISVWAANRFGSGPTSDSFTVNLNPPEPVERLTGRGYVGRSQISWAAPSGGQRPTGYSVTTWDTQQMAKHWTKETPDASVLVRTPREGRSYVIAASTLDIEGQTSSERVVRLSGTRLTVRPSAVLEAGKPSHLGGHVLDWDTATPLASVPVRVQRAPSSDPSAFVRTGSWGRTNADGHFHIDLNPRKGFVYRAIMVRQPGFAGSWSRPIEVG